MVFFILGTTFDILSDNPKYETDLSYPGRDFPVVDESAVTG